jgi:polyisoprenoid-binding protein YceI
MKKIVVLAILVVSVNLAGAQDKYFTKSGKISFYSKASLENIEAHNKTVTCVLDTKTGNMQFAVMMKAFEFEKALMQEHFNENYIESHKFPKADFKGQIINNGDINYSKDGKYTAKVKGKLTMHGQTRDVESTGTIEVRGGKLEADAVFNITLADYNVSIPAMVKDNISKTVSITVDCSLEPFKG